MQSLINKILPPHTRKNLSNLELEARFGKINESGKRDIGKSAFKNLKKFYGSSFSKTENEDTIFMVENGNEQLRVIKQTGVSEIIVEKKTRLQIIDERSINARVALSEEERLDPSVLLTDAPVTLVRKRKRTSFIISESKGTGSFVLDISKNSQFTPSLDNEEALSAFLNNKLKPSTYEAEVEFKPELNVIDYDRNWILSTLQQTILDVNRIIYGGADDVSISEFEQEVLGRNAISVLREVLKHMVDVSQFTTMALIPIENFKVLSLINRPKTMDRQAATKIALGYGVSLKADGEFRLIVGTESLGVVALDSSGRGVSLDNNPVNSNVFPFVAEAEKIGDEYLIYDALIIGNKNLTNMPTIQRFKEIKKLFPFSDKKRIYLKKTLLENVDFGEGMMLKNVYQAADYLLSNNKLPVDGVIAIPMGKYWDPIYKQKPPEKTTIDFLATVSNRQVTLWSALSAGFYSAMNRPPFPPSYAHLFPSFAKGKTVFPFPFVGPEAADGSYPSQPPTLTLEKDEVLDSYTVVECMFDVTERKWKITNKRPDKTKLFLQSKGSDRVQGPNSYQVALATWTLIHYPVTTEMITGKEPIPETHFQTNVSEAEDILKFRQFQSAVTHKILAKNIEGKNVLDLASGRGGSMVRLIRQGAKSIVEVEPDIGAINEAKSRLQGLLEQNVIATKRAKKLKLPIPHISEVEFVNGNLLENIKTKIAAKRNNYDVVVCLMALHFFMESMTTLNTFFKNFNSFVKTGGRVIFTCIDGSELFKKLMEKDIAYGGQLDWYSGAVPPNITMSIRRDFESDVFQKFGQKITTTIEGLGSSSEYLVNIDATLIPFFEKNNYKLVSRQLFGTFLESWRQRDKNDNLPLSADQAQFASMYTSIIFEKQ